MDKNNKISKYDKLVIDLCNNITTRLSDLMSKLLNTAQDKLFDMSDDADSNEEQNRYFDLMNQIRLLKPIIAESFDENIKSYLIPAKDFKSKQEKEKLELDDELSLIDQDVMEGIVLVKGIGEHAAAKYREQLSHVEARLEHLALKTSNIFIKDALMPTNFCQAFDDALIDEFNNDNKKLLFKMFDVEIANNLDALYDSINNRMIDAGVLPQIKLHLRAQKKSPSRPKPQQTATANSDEYTPQNEFAEDGYYGNTGHAASGAGVTGSGYTGGGTGGQAGGGQTFAQAGGQVGGPAGIPAGGSNIGGFAMTAAPGGNYRHNNHSQSQQPLNQDGSTFADGSHGGATTGGGATTSGGSTSGGSTGGGSAGGSSAGEVNAINSQNDEQHTSASDGEYQHYTAGMPASQVGRILGNYIGTPFTPPPVDSTTENYGDFFPESTAQYFGHQEIIQALSNIQNLPQFIQPEQNHVDGEAIKQAVLAEIAKTYSGAITKQINHIAEKTIDFIELIFDAIIDDGEISDTIKTLLLRLQIPVIKASMSDQKFFIYDDHPARILLDSIAEVGIGITEHTDDIYKYLDKIVSNIVSEHELVTETFQNALDRLNEYIEEQNAIIQAKEEEQQKHLLRSHARATVLKALRSTTTGKSLPEAVHPLILKRWPTLMFNHYLANGKENNAWVNLILTLRHIVESAQPITSAEQLARLQREKYDLFERTEQYLSFSSHSKKDVQSVMAAYKGTIQQHLDDTHFTEEEVNFAEDNISNVEQVDEPATEEHTQKPEIPPNAMPGMWFKIHMGENKTARRCKLSVIIIEDANMMFVNHKGELVTEKSFDDFNEEVAHNKTKMIMGHSAFDHAFKAVINQLN